MSILVKSGVSFLPTPALFRMLEVLKDTSLSVGVPLTITSGSDGDHSGPTDPHKTGEAIDVRSHDLTQEQKTAFLYYMRNGLGPLFYVFLESPGKPNEHFHCQRRKQTIYTMQEYLNA